MSQKLVWVVVASYVVSLALRFFLPPRDSTLRARIFFSLPLLVPVLGPIFYIWLRIWPSSLPWDLNGVAAGLGARYLDDQLSRQGNSESMSQTIKRQLMENRIYRAQKERSRSHKKRLKNRLLRKKFSEPDMGDNN
jgi:hypothetical protein